MSDMIDRVTGSAHTNTLSALFDTRADADNAASRLRMIGISENAIRITEGSGTTAGSGTMTSDTTGDKGFFESLGDFFFPAEDRYAYAEGLARGGYLLTVSNVGADMQDAALDILDDEGSVDIDERETMWRAEGWKGSEDTSVVGMAAGALGLGADTTARATGMAEERSAFDTGVRDMDSGDKVEIVEEQLRVGKRETSHGRVRVRSYVVEENASANVELSRDRVEIERRPVDRALTGAEDPFRERTIEAEEFGEEAVIGKEARVVEEIGLRKERDTRTEVVSDTIRRTEVEIEDARDTTGAVRTPSSDKR